jgi:hypothetical protein
MPECTPEVTLRSRQYLLLIFWFWVKVWIQDSSVLQHMQTGYHRASSPLGTGFFPSSTAAGVWCWPLLLSGSRLRMSGAMPFLPYMPTWGNTDSFTSIWQYLKQQSWWLSDRWMMNQKGYARRQSSLIEAISQHLTGGSGANKAPPYLAAPTCWLRHGPRSPRY